MRVVRHVGLPAGLRNQLSLPDFTALAESSGISLRSWHGRFDCAALLCAEGDVLAAQARRFASARAIPVVSLGALNFQRLAIPRLFGEFCKSLASSLASSGITIGGFGGRVPVTGLLEHVLARCLARAHVGKRLVKPASGIVVEFGREPWFRSNVDLTTLAREAGGEWVASAHVSEANTEEAWSSWQSLEALSFAICLRHRDRFVVPDGIWVEICDFPDVVGVLAHSSALAALWPQEKRSTVGAYVESTRASAGDLARALVVCGLASGTMVRRLPLATPDEAQAVPRPESVASALPQAMRALARLLGLAPRAGASVSASQKTAPAPRARTVENKLVICGDFGSGKTTALKTLLEAAAMTMDVAIQNEGERQVKSDTTIGFDFGVLHAQGEPIFIYSAPGQERFRMVAETLLQGAHGAIVLVDASAEKPIDGLSHWFSLIRVRAPGVPVVVALNRVCEFTPSLDAFRAAVRRCYGGPMAVVSADPRSRADMLGVIRLLLVLAGAGSLPPVGSWSD